MITDFGGVKQRIKPLANSTLMNMRKADLVAYIRTLEHNYNVAVEFNENQARYIESLDVGKIIRCKNCKFYKTLTDYRKCTLAVCGRKNLNVEMKEDDFCSRAEQKDDADGSG